MFKKFDNKITDMIIEYLNKNKLDGFEIKKTLIVDGNTIKETKIEKNKEEVIVLTGKSLLEKLDKQRFIIFIF